MSCFAVIPARGGSKGIPRKNVVELGGLPLIAHSIIAARGAAMIDRVFVSTDDAEIASIARRYGAEIIDRPAELASDAASTDDAVLHAVSVMGERYPGEPDTICIIQCTSPLTQSSDFDGGLDTMRRTGVDCVFSATPFHFFLWKQGVDGSMQGVNHSASVRPLRQDREPEWLEAGAFYLCRTEGFIAARHRFFGHVGMYEMPTERVFEIDEPADLEIARRRFAIASIATVADRLPKPVGALICDFDGVITDNKVRVSEDGTESVMCNRSDGMGFDALRRFGLPVLILSKERNPVVSVRARKLKTECIQGCDDKLSALQTWLSEKSVPLARAVFVGNDVNDLDCMRAVGCGVAVADSHPLVCSEADAILSRNGGDGAVRELCDAIVLSLTPDTR